MLTRNLRVKAMAQSRSFYFSFKDYNQTSTSTPMLRNVDFPLNIGFNDQMLYQNLQFFIQ